MQTKVNTNSQQELEWKGTPVSLLPQKKNLQNSKDAKTTKSARIQIYIWTHTYTNIHIYEYMYKYTYMNIHIHINKYVYTNI